MTTETVQPLDLSDLPEAPFAELEELLAGMPENQDQRIARAVRAALLDRALNLLRRGSRTEIGEEARNLHGFLVAGRGLQLLEAWPEFFGWVEAVATLLSEATRRTDRGAVESILRSHRTHGRPLLERLAARSEPMPRAVLREELGLSESHLSHLLRDLEECDLIVRFRESGAKQVLVALGQAGREVVEQSLLPGWVEPLAECLRTLARGESVPDRSALERELVNHGAPTLAAARLTAALGSLVPSLDQEAARRWNDEVRDRYPDFVNRSRFGNQAAKGWLGSMN